MFSWITTALLKLIWTIFVKYELQLISGFWAVFKYLCGDVFFDVLFGTNGKFSPDAFSGKVPAAFWGFWILAAFMVIVVFLVQYFVLMFQGEDNTKERFMKSIKNTIKAAGITIMMPVGFFFGIWIVEFLQGAIFAVFGIKDANLADLLWNVGNPNWDGTHTWAPSDYGAPTGHYPAELGGYEINIHGWNMLSTIFCTWMMMYACAMVGMAVAQKVFELYCLFIIGPIFAATYTIDGGVRFKTWKDSVLGKMAVSVGTFCTFAVMLTVLPLLFKATQSASFKSSIEGESGLIKSMSQLVFQVLIILGAGTFVQTFPTFFANFFGESVGIAEGKNAAASARAAGGMLRSGVLGVAGALGIGSAARKKGMDKQSFKEQLFAAKGGELAGAAQSAGMGGGFGGGAGGGGDVPLRRTGLLGLGGKLMRGGSSVIGGIATGLAATGLFGKKKGREAWQGIKEHIKNTAGSIGKKIKANTWDHAHRRRTDVQNEMQDLRKNTSKEKYDAFFSGKEGKDRLQAVAQAQADQKKAKAQEEALRKQAEQQAKIEQYKDEFKSKA